MNRKIILAQELIKQNDFRLDQLVGFDLNEKTVGVIGTGKIGAAFIRIMNGFGCKILAYDIAEDDELVKKYDVKYTSLENLYKNSDVISVNCPLNQSTKIPNNLPNDIDLTPQHELSVDGSFSSKGCAIGASLQNSESVEVGTVSKVIGCSSSVEAEYRALIEGLKLAVDYRVSRLAVYSDFLSLVNHIKNAEHLSRNATLNILKKEIDSLRINFKRTTFKHIPREENKRAHQLAADAFSR